MSLAQFKRPFVRAVVELADYSRLSTTPARRVRAIDRHDNVRLVCVQMRVRVRTCVRANVCYVVMSVLV
jgi:hypothetical protein